jgi:hypothetical protein
MPRVLALTCLLLLSALARAGRLFDAGVWAPIVLPSKGEDDEWRASRNLAERMTWAQFADAYQERISRIDVS